MENEESLLYFIPSLHVAKLIRTEIANPITSFIMLRCFKLLDSCSHQDILFPCVDCPKDCDDYTSLASVDFVMV